MWWLAEIGSGIGIPAAKAARSNLNTSSTWYVERRSTRFNSFTANDPWSVSSRYIRLANPPWTRIIGPIGAPRCERSEGTPSSAVTPRNPVLQPGIVM
ncbi:hypothetical protein GCM10027610_037510 [Dactylosporangium cerinum]